jgi:hypothetical protein
MSSGRTSGSATVRTRHLGAGAAVALLAAAVGIVIWARHGGNAAAPYHDPAAAGAIGLCDRAGHQVRSGSTTARPFAWLAVGATAAPAAYAASGRSATLYAYQPRSGVPADEWSGRALTAAGFYTSPRHPMAAGTAADVDLADFLAGYPARDGGFVQLRLYLAAPDRPALTSRYDALDIHVSGSTWNQVGGTRIDCSAGRSVSFETQVSPSPAH